MRKDEFINYLQHMMEAVRDGNSYESDVKEDTLGKCPDVATKREITITFKDAAGTRTYLNIVDAQLPRDIVL